MKVYVQNEKHNHPPNKTIMAVRHENDDQIDDTGKIYRKNGMQRCLKKSRKIAKLRPTIMKSNKKNSTIFEQIIHSNLDGPQMSLEQFCQAYWSIELEEQQNKGEFLLIIKNNLHLAIENTFYFQRKHILFSIRKHTLFSNRKHILFSIRKHILFSNRKHILFSIRKHILFANENTFYLAIENTFYLANKTHFT
jgi:hypothetical protein